MIAKIKLNHILEKAKKHNLSCTLQHTALTCHPHCYLLISKHVLISVLVSDDELTGYDRSLVGEIFANKKYCKIFFMSEYKKVNNAALLSYLKQTVIVEHVSTKEQIEGPVEQGEVTTSTLLLGLHHAILVPHFLDVLSDALGTLRGLLHLLLQLLDVLVVLFQGAADGLLRHREQHKNCTDLQQ